MSTRAPGHRPVLVGVGIAMQREEDPTKALDPLGLMLEAVRRAGVDAGTPALLARVGHIAVPRGRWRLRNPARAIAAAIGAERPHTVLAEVGVLQQTLIGEACARIQRGEVQAALVAGADCGWRQRRAQALGIELPRVDPTADSAPDSLLAPADALLHPAELRAGLKAAAGLYAIVHSAVRAGGGRTPAAQRDAMAARYARFSEIAAANPHAWSRTAVPPEAIREPGKGNSMIAFPYNKLHCSNWSVDQAGALLLCSEGTADAVGIAHGQRVFPLSSAESNHMITVAARRSIASFADVELAGRRALDAARRVPADLDLVDLYSSFPAAVEVHALGLRLPEDHDLTVTGGMSFAGGPFNNYVLQATARLAERLRAGEGRSGLVSSVSGLMTKHGFGVWSRDPGPTGFAFHDVTTEVERITAEAPVVVEHEGAGRIVGYTVLGEPGVPSRGVALIDLPGGQRTVAVMPDEAVVQEMLHREFCGRSVEVRRDGTCTVTS